MTQTDRSELARRVRMKTEVAYRGAVARHAIERSDDSLQALHEARDALIAVDALATRWCKAA